jgi:hypothetical protein
LDFFDKNLFLSFLFSVFKTKILINHPKYKTLKTDFIFYVEFKTVFQKKKKKLPEYINKQSLNLLKDFLKSIETILN